MNPVEVIREAINKKRVPRTSGTIGFGSMNGSEAQSQKAQHGEKNPIEKVLNRQEEDCFEQVRQVQKENLVKEISQRDCQDCVRKISQSTQGGKQKASRPNIP